MEWARDPFFGGCHYYSDKGDVVTGLYSPHEPVEFEADCKVWTLNGAGKYLTADSAMAAAEAATA